MVFQSRKSKAAEKDPAKYECPAKLNKILDSMNVDEHSPLDFQAFDEICMKIYPDMDKATLIATFIELDVDQSGFLCCDETQHFWNALFSDDITCQETVSLLRTAINNYEHLLALDEKERHSILSQAGLALVTVSCLAVRPLAFVLSQVDGRYEYSVANMMALSCFLSSLVLSVFNQIMGGENPIIHFWSQPRAYIRNLFICCGMNALSMLCFASALQYVSIMTCVAIQFLSVPVTKILCLEFEFTVLTPLLFVMVLVVASVITLDPEPLTALGLIFTILARITADICSIMWKNLVSVSTNEETLKEHCELTDMERTYYFLHVMGITLYPLAMVIPIITGDPVEASLLIPFYNYNFMIIFPFILTLLCVLLFAKAGAVSVLFVSVVYMVGDFCSMAVAWFFEAPQLTVVLMVTVLTIVGYSAISINDQEHHLQDLEHLNKLRDEHEENLEALVTHDPRSAHLLMEIIQEDKKRTEHELAALSNMALFTHVNIEKQDISNEIEVKGKVGSQRATRRNRMVTVPANMVSKISMTGMFRDKTKGFLRRERNHTTS